MSDPSQGDTRENARKKVLKGGTVAYSGRQVTLPCIVRDISSTGARLRIDSKTNVPDTFELLIELDGLEAPCQVMWRKGQEVGVAFVGTPTKVSPTRAQVVNGPAEGYRPTVRRQAVTNSPRATPPQTAAPHAARTVDVEVRPAPPAANLPIEKVTPTAVAAPPPKSAASVAPVLIAEDDPDDRMLLSDAFGEAGFTRPVVFAADGIELLEYLGKPTNPRPVIIMLDLNMPRLDGREVLRILKSDPVLRRIPVLVLTTSNSVDDIDTIYGMGASAYIPKPGSYDDLVDLALTINHHWLRFVAIPVIESA